MPIDGEPNMTTQKDRFLFHIATLCVVLLFIGIAGSVIFHALNWPGLRGWLAFSVSSIAIVTFFGLARIEMASSTEPWSLRRPIAATIVVVYLILVVTFSFFDYRELPPITEMLLTSFTAVVSVVIAFYFGSSAYIKGKSIKKTGEDAQK